MSEIQSSPGSATPTPADIAVLITVYHKITDSHLDAALRSIAAQTLPPQQVIVVADGPLTASLNDVLRRWEQHYAELSTRFLIHRLEFNSGAGVASQAGLQLVEATWTARLDADDIARPERLEKQLRYATLRRLDVVGTALAEFDAEAVEKGADPEDVIFGVRRLPEEHERILSYARWNSPINHPSVLIRTEAARAVGGYREIRGMEDYDLWVRMLSAGSRCSNMPEPLTLFRAGFAMLERRADPAVIRQEWHMQTTLMDNRLVNRPRAILNVILRTGFRLLPLPLLRRIYILLFHRPGRDHHAGGIA